MHDLIFVQNRASGAGSKQALSDAGHLAHAALARASAFVTRDNAILSARASLIQQFGIDVVTVEELVALLPPDRDDHEVASRTGRGFKCSDASPASIQSYMGNQDFPSDTMDEFAAESQHLVDCVRRMITQGDCVVACAVLLVPRSVNPVCRLMIHARPETVYGELYVDHLLDVMLRDASASAATVVELECIAGQSTLISLAKARGFMRQSSTSALAKVVMGRPVTATAWTSAVQELKLRAGLDLPLEMPVKNGDSQFSIKAQDTVLSSVSLTDLEDMLAPTLLIWPGRAGVIVPISHVYSEELLGTSNQFSLDLMGDKDATFMSKRAYVNTPRASSIMRPEAPILFYETMKGGGAGAVVAVGRIVDSVIVNKKDVPGDALRRLVVDDVDPFSSTTDVLVTTFDNLFSLPNPVRFHHLKKMGAVGPANLVTATRATGRTITQILDTGWRNDKR